MTTIGDITSRLKGMIKAVREDAFITDRFLYSLALKHAKTLVRRQDNENKIKTMDSLFETLPCVELIEISKIAACCAGIKGACTFRRTKDPIPNTIGGSWGPIIRGVSTIDYSTYFNPTWSMIFVDIANSTDFKYNKTKYYWYHDHHLYFPNIDYDAVNIEAIWEDSINYLKCDGECVLRQDEHIAFPDYLLTEVENLVKADLGLVIQTLGDVNDDKQSNLRT